MRPATERLRAARLTASRMVIGPRLKAGARARACRRMAPGIKDLHKADTEPTVLILHAPKAGRADGAGDEGAGGQAGDVRERQVSPSAPSTARTRSVRSAHRSPAEGWRRCWSGTPSRPSPTGSPR